MPLANVGRVLIRFYQEIKLINISKLLILTNKKMWFKTRHRQLEVPFLDFESLLGRSLLDIRQEFDILSFIKENKSNK